MGYRRRCLDDRKNTTSKCILHLLQYTTLNKHLRSVMYCSINLVPVNVRSREENLQINPLQYIIYILYRYSRLLVGFRGCTGLHIRHSISTKCLYLLRIDTYNIILTYFYVYYYYYRYFYVSFKFRPNYRISSRVCTTTETLFVYRNAFCDMISASNRKLKK